MIVPPSRAWRTDPDDVAIPVAKPLLPDADAIAPYLRMIDAARTYTNGGPLVRKLEAGLAAQLGTPGGDTIALVANGTVALTAALVALEVPSGALCMVPAWTFAATAHAVVAAGLVPWFVDVDPIDGTLTPEHATALLARAPARLGAVLPVAPFGAPLAVDGWVAFRARTGIAVVVDAAAGFDQVRVSPIPTAVSLHATKVFGVGEGGFVAWNDPAGVRAVRRYANFGFTGSREATTCGTNAKLSEYAAAVGLAGLSRWAPARAAFLRVAQSYRNALAAHAAVGVQRGFGRDWVTATAVVRLPAGALAAVEDALAAAGIGSRRWWGDGLAVHRAFAACPRTELPVTATLAATTLGLPYWRDLSDEAIAHIVDVVVAALH